MPLPERVAGWSSGRCSIITDCDPLRFGIREEKRMQSQPSFFLRRVTIKSSFDNSIGLGICLSAPNRLGASYASAQPRVHCR